MRNTFIKKLTEYALSNPKIELICGDLGFSVLEEFRDSCFNQFLNAGIAEQNMTGIAAGMALMGKKVFTYSIANFPVFRCLEQIRNDVCYHNLDVNIISIGAGFSYGTAGYSHFGIEDVAVMEVLPNITIYNPANNYEALACLKHCLSLQTPSYTRILKGAGINYKFSTPLNITNNKIVKYKNGEELLLVASGGSLDVVIKAHDHLENLGYKIGVISCPILKPFPIEEFKRISSTYKSCLIVENLVRPSIYNNVNMDEILLAKTYIKSMYLKDIDLTFAGSESYLMNKNQLSVEDIIKESIKLVQAVGQ